MDKFASELAKAQIGTHTTIKAKREFLIFLYDSITYCKGTDLALDMEVLKILMKADTYYSLANMPTYYKATLCTLRRDYPHIKYQ